MSKSDYQNNLESFRDKGDIDSPIVRYYRCWIDGSYNGEAHYKRNVEFVKQAVNELTGEICQGDPLSERRYKILFKRLTAYAINEWRDYISYEYEITPRQVDSITKKIFPWGPELRRFNYELVEYLLDLAFDLEADKYTTPIKAALERANLVKFSSSNDCFNRKVN